MPLTGCLNGGWRSRFCTAVVWDPDLVERFRREARTAARLSHPNIVTAIDRGEWRGRPYIVLEYIEGTNLKQLVLGERQVPIRDALELAVQIGRGLGYAHRHGVVHRDVKPQNVLLGVGEAKVTDFGVALSSDLDELTLTGSIVGTSDYLAPEQADGRAADERSDVYSLGVVVFELLTGAPPFSGDSFLDVALQHLLSTGAERARTAPRHTPRIAAAVARALAKVPGSRFQSRLDEFVAQLEACRADGDPSDGATMIREPPRSDTIGHRPRNRRRLLVSAAALALFAAAAVIGVPFPPLPEPPPGPRRCRDPSAHGRGLRPASRRRGRRQPTAAPCDRQQPCHLLGHRVVRKPALREPEKWCRDRARRRQACAPQEPDRPD